MNVLVDDGSRRLVSPPFEDETLPARKRRRRTAFMAIAFPLALILLVLLWISKEPMPSFSKLLHPSGARVTSPHCLQDEHIPGYPCAILGSNETDLARSLAKPLYVRKGFIVWDGPIWETDFVLNDVLYDLKHWDLVDHRDQFDSSVRPVVYVVTHPTNDSFFNHTLEKIAQFKPFAVVLCSDETGSGGNHLAPIAECTRLVLYQYHHPSTPQHPHLHQLPLGYMRGMFKGVPWADTVASDPGLIVPAGKRGVSWAFVGNEAKSDRPQMLEAFKAIVPGGTWSNDRTAAQQQQIYRDAVFVPNGRGWSSLDCFRLYEAAASGAIPVVVGKEEEFAVTLRHWGDRPPFIYADNWTVAATTCQTLLRSTDLLEVMQSGVVRWWARRLLRVRQLIRQAAAEELRDARYRVRRINPPARR